jgi:hypothetical protein
MRELSHWGSVIIFSVNRSVGRGLLAPARFETSGIRQLIGLVDALFWATSFLQRKSLLNVPKQCHSYSANNATMA